MALLQVLMRRDCVNQLYDIDIEIEYDIDIAIDIVVYELHMRCSRRSATRRYCDGTRIYTRRYII